MWRTMTLAAVVWAAILTTWAAAGAGELNLVPAPISVTKAAGSTALSTESRIVCAEPGAAGVAQVLAEELEYIHGLAVKVAPAGTAAKAGDIVLARGNGLRGEQYRMVADGKVMIEAGAIGGFHAGTATLVQAVQAAEGKAAVPNCTIRDEPFRDFRALMVDVKFQGFSPQSIYQFIRLCRFYKVRYFSLHTGEPQWIGSVIESSNDYETNYSPAQMAAFIAYGRRLGVYLLPHNESTPGFPTLRTALTGRINAASPYANFVDEFDGKGPYAYDGKPDARFWDFMAEATRRAVDQFAAGFPDGHLPYYHIGPVLGEGGMGPDVAAKFLDVLMKKDPGIRMVLWDGVNARDGHLYPHRKNVVVAYYSGDYSSSKIHDYLREGWDVINAPFYPLYILGEGGQTPADVFAEWNVLSAGMGAKRVKFDLQPAWAKQVLGGMVCTWEISQAKNLEYIRQRLPAFAEHAWNYKPLPYATGAFEEFEPRAKAADSLVEKVYQGPADTTPPSAKPPVWKHAPRAVGNLVVMQARPMVDASGVEYKFECTQGGGPSSDWQAGSYFVAEDLLPEAAAAWRVKVRDRSAAHNETAWSAPATVTTGKAFETKLVAHFTFVGEVAHGKPAPEVTGNVKGAGYSNQVQPRGFPHSLYFGGQGVQVEGGWTCVGLGDVAGVLNPILDGFSISLWTAPNADKGGHQLFVSGTKEGKRSFSLANTYDEVVLDVGDAKGTQYKAPAVVVTFAKRAPDACEVKFYINGRQIGRTLTGTAAPGAGPGWTLNETSIVGAVADVRVYKGVLSPRQVQFLADPAGVFPIARKGDRR
ncbi:MAG: family 20 glycosylhydrolase [Planctomycetota bacterium]|nr:family 20 glycosylhydrolase [Planctomycetota bacterium]